MAPATLSQSTPEAASAQEVQLYASVPAEGDAFALGWLYPAPYSVAVTSLGYLSLFRDLDVHPRVTPQRIYSDTLTPESLVGFPLLGFSFAFELDALYILEMLERGGIPLYADQRGEDHPLVFAGGPVPITNPEPYAPFFDFFLIGEGEPLIDSFITAYDRIRHRGLSRIQQLIALANDVPGLYAPSLYEVSYGDDGAITAIENKYEGVPPTITKQMLTSMDTQVAQSPIVSNQAVFPNTYFIEVMRGCAHRCRFCLASYSMLPARGPGIEPILQAMETGYSVVNKLGLMGALIADHPQFDEICDALNHYIDQDPRRQVSAASFRADTLTPAIAQTFKRGGQRKLTIAVESGSNRMRRRINKHLSHEAIMNAASAVADAGLDGLKLYCMVGLPDETDEDVDETIAMAKAIKKAHPKLKLTLGCSTFVPKAATPFQWQPRPNTPTLKKRHQQLKKGLLNVAEFRPSSSKWDYFQAVLSRGDRRLAPVVEEVYRLGGSLGSLRRAFKTVRDTVNPDLPDMDWYGLRERPETEVFPWEHIALGVDKTILYKEGVPPTGWESLPSWQRTS